MLIYKSENLNIFVKLKRLFPRQMKISQYINALANADFWGGKV